MKFWEAQLKYMLLLHTIIVWIFHVFCTLFHALKSQMGQHICLCFLLSSANFWQIYKAYCRSVASTLTANDCFVCEVEHCLFLFELLNDV